MTTTGLLAWLWPVDLIAVFCYLLAWALQLFGATPRTVRVAVAVVGIVLLAIYLIGAFGSPVHFGR
jgi:hypothetical protein